MLIDSMQSVTHTCLGWQTDLVLLSFTQPSAFIVPLAADTRVWECFAQRETQVNEYTHESFIFFLKWKMKTEYLNDLPFTLSFVLQFPCMEENFF